jgi:hypothetical protein
LLSKDAPRKSEDVEKMIAKKSVLNELCIAEIVKELQSTLEKARDLGITLGASKLHRTGLLRMLRQLTID